MSEESNILALMHRMAPDFVLHREVEVRHALFTRRRLRVDVLAIPREPTLADIALAFEVKGHAEWSSETLGPCLRQAGEYVFSKVEARDPQAAEHNGKRIMATFVYPPLPTRNKDMTIEQAYLLGMAQSVGAGRVGFLRWQQNSSGPYLQIMCPAVVWNSQRGWAKNARDILVGKRQIGSQRFNILQELTALDKGEG